MRHSIRILKWIFFIQILFIGISRVYSGAPHIITGTLKYADDTSPALVSFSAYLLKRPSEILTESSPDCGYDGGVWTVQCGSFPSS